MELKIAREELNSEPEIITLEKIEEMLLNNSSVIFYFDRDNAHKDLLNLQDYFEEQKKSCYIREVRYGLNDNEYMYEVHIL